MYEVTATAKSRLVLTKEAEITFHAASHHYVPGHLVLACLASSWILTNGLPVNDEFTSIFHSPSIRFGPLLAEGSFIEPVSYCRAKPGSDAGGESSGSEWDRAFGEEPNVDTIVEGKGRVVRAPTISTTRVQLEPYETMPNRYRAAESKLFSLEAISPRSAVDGRPTVLNGVIYGEHRWLDRLASEPHGSLMWLGADRSSAGRVEVVLRRVEQPEQSSFGNQIVLRLTSPAIFVDDAGRPMFCPTSRDLDRVFGPGRASLVKCWFRPDQLGGWHMASGLPRPQELVAVPGSTYLIDVERADSDWPARLRTVGLGLRTHEGFGFAEVVDSPWRRPPEPTQGQSQQTRTALTAQDLFLKHRSAFNDRRIRRWLLDVLRDAEVAHASDNEFQDEQFFDHVVNGGEGRSLNHAQGQAIKEMCRQPIGVIDGLLALFDDALEQAEATP